MNFLKRIYLFFKSKFENIFRTKKIQENHQEELKNIPLQSIIEEEPESPGRKMNSKQLKKALNTYNNQFDSDDEKYKLNEK